MNPIASQQAALDNSLVAPEKRLKIERCNARIAFTKPLKEETYQVTSEALKLSPCYLAFQITAEVLEIYMHQFGIPSRRLEKHILMTSSWIRKSTELTLKNLVTFASVTCYLPFERIKCTSLGGNLLLSLTSVSLGKQQDLIGSRNHELKSCRLCIIRRMLIMLLSTGKTLRIKLTTKKLVQQEKAHALPKFTKVIIDHFISKDNTIFMRNMINLHTVRDDSLLCNLKFVSKIEDCQSYGALIPDGMINDDIKLSATYKTYLYYATRKVPPKKARKFKKHASPKLRTKKAPTKADRGKGIELLSDDALLEDAQLKKTLRKSKRGDSEDESGDVYDEDDNDDYDGNDDDSNYEEEEQDEQYVYTSEKDKSDDNEKMYEEEDNDQEEDDGHVTLTPVHDKTEGTMQSSYVSSDLTSKLLNLDNTGPYVNEITSLMNTATVPSLPPPVNPSPHLTTISPQPTPDSTTTTNLTMSLPEISNFASLFQFDQRYLAFKVKEVVDVVVQIQSNKLKEEAEPENQEFFNQVDSTMKEIIKEKTSYAVAASLSVFKLKKIVIEKIETIKSINRSDIQKNLYNTLVEAYNSDKDIITSYGDAVTLKRGRDDQDKDEDPSARSDQGTKRRKSSKDDEPSKGSKSSSTSKGTQSHLIGKPLPLIEDRERQVVPADYFINNDLEYLKGRSLSRKYMTSTTRTKATKYDNIKGIEDMVPTLWSLVKVAGNRYQQKDKIKAKTGQNRARKRKHGKVKVKVNKKSTKSKVKDGAKTK
uniref:Uncharacterized protein n=1 Tax=Tanacetum cinerariifolium TaxID=118510 RepID=A0A699HK50_TANCI|nr:hypothetical protein [Tanacetum cinerariifolium]